MAGTLSQSSAFRIQILEGPLSTVEYGQLFGSSNKPGLILLVGRALPYQPISYEVVQREKTTYNPGNPVATQQVFGAIDSPTVITGKWKDTFLGNGVARQFVNAFEELCRTGSLIEVQWGDGSIDLGPDESGPPAPRNPYVRRGILKRFKWTPDRPQDIAWEMEFRWRGRDENAAPPTFNLAQINPGEALAEADSIFNDTSDAVLGFTQSPLVQFLQFPQTIQATFNEQLDSAEIAIEGLHAIIETIPATAQVALDVANRITGLLDLARSSFDAIQGNLLDIRAESMIVTDQGLQELDFLSQRLVLLQALDVAKAQAISQQNSVDAMVLPDILAEVRPPAGTDLRQIAFQFYGDADMWFVIAQANGLSSSRVPDNSTGPSDNPNQSLRIPRQTQSTISSLPNAISAEGT